MNRSKVIPRPAHLVMAPTLLCLLLPLHGDSHSDSGSLEVLGLNHTFSIAPS
jgi:hypothetical protein